MKLHKKGQAISTLQSMVGPLIGVAIVLIIGFVIFSEMRAQTYNIASSDFCPTNYSFINSTAEAVCCNNSHTVIACESGNRTSPGFSLAWNSTRTTGESLDDIPGWLPIMIVAVIGAAILGLVAYFRGR